MIRRNHLKNDPPWLRRFSIRRLGFRSQTVLCRHTMATLHTEFGSVVMEDSQEELRQHLPIWISARGRVLVTGLGLGCVVRGLLANPRVTHITVLELDKNIIRICGREFMNNPRVTIIHTDALKYQPKKGERWDFAWHDLWNEDAPTEHLQLLHARLFAKFKKHCGPQGAWKFPKIYKRLMRRHGVFRLLG
jgi:spermidine synthase